MRIVFQYAWIANSTVNFTETYLQKDSCKIYKYNKLGKMHYMHHKNPIYTLEPMFLQTIKKKWDVKDLKYNQSCP